MLVDATGIQSAGSPGSGVTGAIQKAANATGVSFQYLLATAQVESRLNPNAVARTSSARGLYQFIDQTWLGTMKTAGASLGYGRYADAISRLPSGRYEVSDPGMRDAIMKLRSDPTANAAMAGAFTQQNADRLQNKLGRQATDGELYIAHFLGAGGAGRLISRASTDPNAVAADAFPNAARANRSIFYDKQGNSRTVSQVYAALVGRYDVARAQSLDAVRTASAVSPVAAPSSTAPTTVVPVTRTPIENLTAATNVAAAANTASSVTAVTATTAATQGDASARTAGGAEPMFHSMFRPEDRMAGVSQLVRDLWTSRPTVAAALTGMAVAPTRDTAGGAGLDLFKDQSRYVQGVYDRRS
jgi:Transglycosylase SLT domain